MKIQLNVCAQVAGERAIDLLASHAPGLSRQQLKQAMQKGAVWLKPAGKKTQKRLRRVTCALKIGDTLALNYDSELLARSVEPAQLIADEKQYSVWNKPAGMLAQGTLFGDHCSLLAYAEQHLQPRRPCFLVHRLDSAANGLMLIAHTERAAAELSRRFQQRQMTKRYRVIVEGHVDSSLQKIDDKLDDKEAFTYIESIQHLSGDRSALAVSIETGRKHQIRRHLSMHGHPVVGDQAYGSQCRNEPLQLVANELVFICPLSQKQKKYFLT